MRGIKCFSFFYVFILFSLCGGVINSLKIMRSIGDDGTQRGSIVLSSALKDEAQTVFSVYIVLLVPMTLSGVLISFSRFFTFVRSQLMPFHIRERWSRMIVGSLRRCIVDATRYVFVSCAGFSVGVLWSIALCSLLMSLRILMSSTIKMRDCFWAFRVTALSVVDYSAVFLLFVLIGGVLLCFRKL